MKTTSLLTAIILAFAANSQYKRFGINAFGTTNNFDSHAFYSSPGIGAQFNFKRVFSLNFNYSIERIKLNSTTFNDLNSTYSNLYNTLDYGCTQLMFRSSFGKKVLFFLEVGVALGGGPIARADMYEYDNYDQTDSPDFYTFSYTPYSFKSVLPSGGVGVNFPIYKNIHAELFARRSPFKELTYITNDVYFFTPFNESSMFRGVKLSLSIVYQFNGSKNSKYTFSTVSPHFVKNEH